MNEHTCKNVYKEWEKIKGAGAKTTFCCSKCGAHYVDCECYFAALADANGRYIRTNYCPNCGAEVVGRMSELKHCPLCGVEAVSYPTYDIDTDEVDGWYAWCFNNACECVTFYQVQEQAVIAWVKEPDGHTTKRTCENVRGHCSKCGAIMYDAPNYCLNCGAKVAGE